MLSYRHSFHAGNFADLLKHLTQVYLLNYLNRKDKPYFYLDTHAGTGFYSLHSPEAEKTTEYSEGIARLFAAEPKHPFLREFKALISSFNKSCKKWFRALCYWHLCYLVPCTSSTNNQCLDKAYSKSRPT